MAYQIGDHESLFLTYCSMHLQKFLEFSLDDVSHLLRGVHAPTFKPKFGNGIDAVSEKDSLIISRFLADTQLEIDPEQFFVFQDV